MKPTQLFPTCLVGLAFPTVGLAQASNTTQPESQSSEGANQGATLYNERTA